MKDEVEGSYIPVKAYELVLPKDFKIEEGQDFAPKLPIKKKLDKTKGKPGSKQTKSIEAISLKEPEEQVELTEEEDTSEVLFSELQSEKPQNSAPKPSTSSKILKASTIPEKKSVNKASIRPYSAVTAKPPSYLATNTGKTLKELSQEESQKAQAKEFVNGLLEQADKKRKDSLKEFELKEKPFKNFDNKLSDEINELMKKLKSTRSHASRSIKTMKKTLEAGASPQISKPEFVNNPFKSNIVYKNSKNPSEISTSQKLDLRNLYGSVSLTQSWATVQNDNAPREDALISDDEEFVKDIEFD